MGDSVSDIARWGHLLLPDRAESMAKVGPRRIRKPDVEELSDVAGALRDAIPPGWSLKELAKKLDRDSRQVARWLEGKERPHIDAWFRVPELRGRLLMALSTIAPEADVSTVITVRVVKASGGQ